jgi:hypothetical protein
MFDLKYRKRLCIPSKDALKDMSRHNIPPSLVERIVIEGEGFRDKHMVKNEIGRSIKKGRVEIIVKLVPSYSYSLDEEVWLIKHIGKRRLKK